MNITFDRFELRPYPNGLCWELFEFRTVNTKGGEVEKWVSAGCYPSTLSHGLSMIYERMLKIDAGRRELAEAMDRAESIARGVGRAAKGCGK